MDLLTMLRPLLPSTAEATPDGHLQIGGCDTLALAEQFGTPLYIFDEVTIRESCRAYRQALQEHYPDSLVIYACKALANITLLRLLSQEGLGCDVVSGGEVIAAHRAGIPMEKVYFHGNNKTEEELELALELGVGRIVVDNFHELALLGAHCQRRGQAADVLLRLSPGVEAHTHDYLKTGILDSKFGFPIATGQADIALAAALRQPNLRLIGLHCHIGTQIFEAAPYQEAIARVFAWAGQAKARWGFSPSEFSPGGGWGIQYTLADDPPAIAEAVREVAEAVKAEAARAGIPTPRLILEPGRSIVGRAGVALYTVGAKKEIPDVRTYVSVDGGMADNIRPALYGAKYSALLANRASEEATTTVTIAGKYCESGDLLLRDVSLPDPQPGDLLAVPASGAYCLAMASNYNLAPRPAVVMVADGRARLIRRRESYDDLFAPEVF